MAVELLVGTTKGLFILDGAQGWRLSGPFCEGWPINHAVGDRETGVVWAAGGSGWHGPGVWRRVGGEWAVSKGPFGGAEQIWALGMDAGQQDGGRLLAGTKPAALWESVDGGVGWAKLEGLTDQEGAEAWVPGAAGLVLHSILCGGQGPVVGGDQFCRSICQCRWRGELGAAGAAVEPAGTGGGFGARLGRRGGVPGGG